MQPKLSIVILCWNDQEVIHDAIRSIYEKTKAVDFEVIVSDNGSAEGCIAGIRKVPGLEYEGQRSQPARKIFVHRLTRLIGFEKNQGPLVLPEGIQEFLVPEKVGVVTWEPDPHGVVDVEAQQEQNCSANSD